MAEFVSVKVDDKALQVEILDPLRARVTNYSALLEIAGKTMFKSIAQTFSDEGSPAGSWPRLALSTLRGKKYTPGHKLLIMSGLLRSSINSSISGNTLTIGTDRVYAGVHQYGSADRSGGSVGAQARIAGRGVKVDAHDALRTYRRYGRETRVDKNGVSRNVRVRLQDQAVKYGVKAHKRFQNIPARPFIVFRPEDPGRIATGIEVYLTAARGKAAGKFAGREN